MAAADNKMVSEDSVLVDPEDLGDVLLLVEKSYDIKFVGEKTGIEFKDRTVGDLVRRMTSVNYLKCRLNTGSVNRKEIEHKLALLLKDQLGLPRTPERSDVLI